MKGKNKRGWFTLRHAPAKEKKGQENPYFQDLEDFFDEYSICDECDGSGVVYPKNVTFARKAEAIVKFKGIPELEKLIENPYVESTEIIRDILERKIMGKMDCHKCKGVKYIKKRKRKK